MQPLDMFRLDGKVALVTGASSGLGERFARVLHAAGATVVVAARRLDRLEALAESLGERAVAVECDVTDDAQRQTLVAEAHGLEARIDILVNNAGATNTVAAEDETLENFRAIVEVNLTAQFGLAQLVGRHMIGQGHGSIVNVASVLGLVASAPIKQASYVASKHGVVGLTRELGAEWARKGVRVNAIAPGWFPSELTGDMFTDDSSISFIERNAPIARAGRADELAGALLFLASDASTYVVGQTLAVDGGWTIR